YKGGIMAMREMFRILFEKLKHSRRGSAQTAYRLGMIPSHSLVALVPFFLCYTLASPIDHGLAGVSDVTAEEEVVNDITTVRRKPQLKQCRAWKYADKMVHYCLASKYEHPKV